MSLRSKIVGVCVVGVGVATETPAVAQQGPCSSVREHRKDTVIVFQPPSSFTVCRNGSAETGVVTDRSVYLQLAPGPIPTMFDYRIRKNPDEWAPTGLGAWEERLVKTAGTLRDLDHSGQPIANVGVPLEPVATSTPLRTLAAARTRYLADVTPKYLEALHAVREQANELSVAARVARQWCGSAGVLGSEVPGALTSETELKATCAGPELKEGVMESAVSKFEVAADEESAASRHARDAALAAAAHPEDATAVADASRALDDARLAADAVISAAHALREPTATLARDFALLHAAVRAIDGLVPGVPTYLSTYSRPANAVLEIEAIPNDVAVVGTEASRPRAIVTGRFPVFGRHYLDIEVGIAWTAGVPESPYLETVQANRVIQSKTVDQFAGLALAELEPLRFLWPERPLAGLLRLPVIGIPFTRDPTSNFFVGAGLGWTDVGSVTAGPYLIRETTLRQSFYVNEILPSGVPFGAVTEPGLHTGYFVSASIDLLGLFHVFFPPRPPTIDAVTGKEK